MKQNPECSPNKSKSADRTKQCTALKILLFMKNDVHRDSHLISMQVTGNLK